VALLMIIGIPTSFVTQTIQDRAEREAGYRLIGSGASRLGI
jgi:AsmA protein